MIDVGLIGLPMIWRGYLTADDAGIALSKEKPALPGDEYRFLVWPNPQNSMVRYVAVAEI
ncbi:hypothetical protein [Variovorax gossypii]